MAQQQLHDDLDLGIERKAKPKNKLIIIVAILVVVLLLLGLGVGWFLLSGGEENETQGEDETAQQSKVQQPAIYHRLDPLFIANLPPGGSANMLQAGIQIMVRDAGLVEFMQHHDPMIRHTLLNLLGTQDADSLQQRKGKEKLQSAVLKALNKLIEEQGGPGPVEAVYFTSFVMQ